MQQFDVVGIGYPSIDYSIKLNNQPNIGKTSLIENHQALIPNFGGCAVNITYLLNSFGKNSALSMVVGKNFSEIGFENFLKENNVSLDFVQYDKDLDTSYSLLIMDSEGEHTTLFYPGPMTTKNYKPYNYEHLNARFGLLTIGEINGNKQFMEACIDKNIPLIFSMKGDYASLDRDYLIKAFEYSELIFMNKTEYNQLNQYLPKKVLDYLENNLLEAIVVTDGSKGSTIFTQNDTITVPALKNIKVIDTAGGGDAYIAGFLNSYLAEETLKECAITGTAVSSYIIEDFGCLTNIPNKNQIKKRKNIIKGEMIDE